MNCKKCWDSPCSCGWEYRIRGTKNMQKFITNILQYRSKVEAIHILKETIENIRNTKNWKGEDAW